MTRKRQKVKNFENTIADLGDLEKEVEPAEEKEEEEGKPEEKEPEEAKGTEEKKPEEPKAEEEQKA